MITSIGFSLQPHYDRPVEQVVALLKDAGFSAVSPLWAGEDYLSAVADSALPIQSLHAPQKGIPALWQSAPCVLLETMLQCVEACGRFNIPILVIHGWQGHDYTFPHTPLYYEKFDRILERAGQLGVTVAFENLEGEEYLYALMQRYPQAGFCWDSGHDHCYPHKLDFLEAFGSRLCMTHLNDNLGQRGPTPCGLDDLHYLPGDGCIDWPQQIAQLKNGKRQALLNFEIKRAPRSPGDDRYSQLPLERFIAEAGIRARQIARLYDSFFP